MTTYTRANFMTDQDVRWCPGCGDYAVLASMQKVLPTLGIPKENMVFVSGIGCSSRFPYYLNTYGFHTIHGRAPTIATGLKLSRPELSVWIVTGDGDGLSIGLNHLMHLMRRNVDVTVCLFNNQIYGLTKGQYSPTSQPGQKTKTSPQGSQDMPLSPVAMALAANCSFVARSIDIDSTHLQSVLTAAAQHRGTSFVEILQNCHVFHDGAFAHISDRGVRGARLCYLNADQPLVNGDGDIGLSFDRGQFVNDTPKQADNHDETHWVKAQALAQLSWPDTIVPMGIFYRQSRPCYTLSAEDDRHVDIQSILEQA